MRKSRHLALIITLSLLLSSSLVLVSCKDSSEDTSASQPSSDTSSVESTFSDETSGESTTEKKAGKPVVKKAVGEYDSYNDYNIYKPETVEIVPGTDYRDYTYKDMNEIKQHIDGDYPGGFLDVEYWLTEIGINPSDIDKSDHDNIIIKNDDNGIVISLGKTGVSYSVGNKTICRYESGRATTRNKRVYLFEETPKKKFSYLAEASAETVDVLEVFANAYLAGSTEDPLANVA